MYRAVSLRWNVLLLLFSDALMARVSVCVTMPAHRQTNNHDVSEMHTMSTIW